MDQLLAFLASGAGAASGDAGGQRTAGTAHANGAAVRLSPAAPLAVHHDPHSAALQHSSLAQALLGSIRANTVGIDSNLLNELGRAVANNQPQAHHPPPAAALPRAEDPLTSQLATKVLQDYYFAQPSHHARTNFLASIENHFRGTGLTPNNRAELIRGIVDYSSRANLHHASQLQPSVAVGQQNVHPSINTADSAPASQAALNRMLMQYGVKNTPVNPSGLQNTTTAVQRSSLHRHATTTTAAAASMDIANTPSYNGGAAASVTVNDSTSSRDETTTTAAAPSDPPAAKPNVGTSPDESLGSAASSTVAAATAAKSIDAMDLLATVAASRLGNSSDEANAALSRSPALNGHAEDNGTGAGLNSYKSPNLVNMFPGHAVQIQQGPPLSHSQHDMATGSANEQYSVPRKVGRIRRYSQQRGGYGAWEDMYANSGPGEMRINLNRGGTIGLYMKMLQPEEKKSLSTAMHQCKLYRQYIRSQVFHEPRFHVLLSSKAEAGRGYMYHGIHMKAQPIDLIPEVEKYAKELARCYRLPQDEWNIGVDLIVYRDGDDSIGWHADNTQGEFVVLCVVVDAPGDPRAVHIRPNKRAKKLADGDEEIQLTVEEGDAYDMDGIMQCGYEHSLPKRRDDKSPRFVLIFRHGCEAQVPRDSGTAITEMAALMPRVEDDNLMSLLSRLRVKPPPIAFGHPQYVHEGAYYSRRFLYSINAHRADQRGVNGNVELGCDSIVVSRQNPDCREEDGLLWLRYTSNRRQGAGALCKSYSRSHPVRVFRSSNLKTEYAPPELEGGQTSYRYDGLYIVTKVWDEHGNLLGKENLDIPTGGIQFTFHLERLPKTSSQLEASMDEATAKALNSLSVDEIWEKIQLSHGRQPTDQFAPRLPQHVDKLPELPNDVAKCNVEYMTDQSGLMTRSSSPSSSSTPEGDLSGQLGWIPPWRNSDGTLKNPPINNDGSGVDKSGADKSGADESCQFTDPQLLCDFTNAKSILTTFPFIRGRGKLSPLLTDIAKCNTKEDKAHFVRVWRTMTKEAQKKYKKDRREYKEQDKKRRRDEKVAAKEEKEKEKVAAKDAKETETDSEAIEPEEMRKREELLAAKRMQATTAAEQEMEVFAHSVILAQYWNSSSILVSDMALGGIELFASEAINTIFGNGPPKKQRTKKSGTKKLLKSVVKKRPTLAKKEASIEKIPAKVKDTNAQLTANAELAEKKQSKATKPMPSRNTKGGKAQTPEPAIVVERSRPVMPRFITLEDGRMQSLSYPCEAFCKIGRRKVQVMKVTLKWSAQASQTKGAGNEGKQMSDRKRKRDESEQIAVDHARNQHRQMEAVVGQGSEGLTQSEELESMKKSPRLSKEETVSDKGSESNVMDTAQHQRATFLINESIFAHDGEVVYKAKVLKIKDEDAKDGPRYYIHYLGFKKSHDKWITENDMTKSIPSSPDKEPRIGMRVRVRFDNAMYYGGKIIKVFRRKKTAAHYVVRIHYDDGEVDEGEYPHPDIYVDPGKVSKMSKKTGNKRKKGVRMAVDAQSPRRKSSRLAPEMPEQDGGAVKKSRIISPPASNIVSNPQQKEPDKELATIQQSGAEENSEPERNSKLEAATAKYPKRKSPRRMPQVLAEDGEANRHIGNSSPSQESFAAASPQPKAQKMEAAPTVPEIGQRVKVKFDEGIYAGKIVKVREKRKMRDTDQPSFFIRINFDDGQVETATFPDSDIHLDHDLTKDDEIEEKPERVSGAASKHTCAGDVQNDVSASTTGGNAADDKTKSPETTTTPPDSKKTVSDNTSEQDDEDTEATIDGDPKSVTPRTDEDSEKVSGVASNHTPEDATESVGRTGTARDNTSEQDEKEAVASASRKVKTAKPRTSSQRQTGTADDDGNTKRRQTRSRGDTKVPQVGMGVKVRFEGGQLFSGVIAKVRAQRKTNESDKDTYNIRIDYDDGDTENTTYPDPEIFLQ